MDMQAVILHIDERIEAGLLPGAVCGVFLAEPVSDFLAATITTITFFARFDKILDRGAAYV